MANLLERLKQSATWNKVQSLQATPLQPNTPGTAGPAPVSTIGTPLHVTNLQASKIRTSDIATNVVVTFLRNPNDTLHVQTNILVSGYKGNPQPAQVASGQSPVRFSLENTGESVVIHAQAQGQTGVAPLQSAPTTTLKLVQTPLATVVTAAGNGPAPPPTPAASGPPTPPCTRWAIIAYNSANPAVLGLTQAVSGAGLTEVDATTTETNYAAQSTTGAGNNIQGINWSAGSTHAPYRDNISAIAGRIMLPSTANLRVWFGLVDTQYTGPNSMKADAPAQNFMGFRYSTAAGDTNWQCVTQTAALSQTVTDSGKAVSTAGVTLAMTWDGTTATFYINNVKVGSQTTNIPANNIALNFSLFVDDVGLSNVVTVQYNYVLMQHPF